MKTQRQFEEIHDDFYKMAVGKIGESFYCAVIEFMHKHGFQSHVISCLLESDTAQILFFTDHLKNNVGILFFEIFGICSYSYVGRKQEVMNLLKRAIE